MEKSSPPDFEGVLRRYCARCRRTIDICRVPSPPSPLRRCLRLNQIAVPRRLTMTQIAEESRDGASLRFVEWLGTGTEYVDVDRVAAGRVSHWRPSQEGRVYGIDVASAAAVEAMGPITDGDRILDLCCAPGAKLSVLIEKAAMAGPACVVVGVDSSAERLQLCWSLLRRCYGGAHSAKQPFLPMLHLIHSDGTAYPFVREGSLSAIRCVRPCLSSARRNRKKQKGTYAAPSHRPVTCASDVGVGNAFPMQTFDKILVDAECTTDASLKGCDSLDEWVIDLDRRMAMMDARETEIAQLQLRLLCNALELVAPNGCVVYSTCSLSVAQNEDVVSRALQQRSDVELEAVPLSESWHCERSSLLPHTLFFNPLREGASGLFIARIHKRMPM